MEDRILPSLEIGCRNRLEIRLCEKDFGIDREREDV